VSKGDNLLTIAQNNDIEMEGLLSIPLPPSTSTNGLKAPVKDPVHVQPVM
jgi:hypothetical protein